MQINYRRRCVNKSPDTALPSKPPLPALRDAAVTGYSARTLEKVTAIELRAQAGIMWRSCRVSIDDAGQSLEHRATR